MIEKEQEQLQHHSEIPSNANIAYHSNH